MDGVQLVDVEDVRGGVDAALEGHLDVLRAELAGYGPDARHLVDALGTALEGGKRLRAAFCYWSWSAHRGRAGDADRTAPPDPSAAATRATVLRVGAALELFQAAALVHDDVMDGSDTRRGRPAAHRAFEGEHRTRGWTGPADQFGVSAAILLGDLALIASEREVTGAVADLPRDVACSVRAVFDVMRTEVTAGQYLDVLAEVQPWGDDADADERRARAVLRSKSARYSVEHPLTLGAALAGAGPEDLARCRRVGLPLGEAFQLRDDLLGVFGDPSRTGKPAGDDLREGKRTVLVARALRAASPDQRTRLLTDLGRRDLSPADVEGAREVLRATGAVDSVEALITSLAEPALAELEKAPLQTDARAVLVALGRAAVDRQA